MRILRLFAVAILLTAAMSTSLFAGDYAEFKFIGFSENGKYMAFEESGEWDGSGGDYATTYYIDVAKNSFAIQPSVFEWEMDSMKTSAEPALLARYKARVAAGLKKLGIVRGNTGKQVVAHLMSDHSFEKTQMADTIFYERDGTTVQKDVPVYDGGFLVPNFNFGKVIFTIDQYPVNRRDEAQYELTLNAVDASKPCAPNSTEEGAPRVELTLKPDINHRDLAPQILQKDGIIPKRRNCPSSYSIEQVYVYKGNIAVFLNMYSQGFEGMDMRYMAVTGAIEYLRDKEEDGDI